MPRYTPDGKRKVHKTRRIEPPRELLASIDAGAAKVMELQRDRDDLRDHARRHAEDALAGHLSALRSLHAEARAWQAGEREEG
jgi:hypothetical protein